MKIIIAESTRKNKKHKANVEGEKKRCILGRKMPMTTRRPKIYPTQQLYCAPWVEGKLGSQRCDDPWLALALAPLGEKTLPAAVRAASDMYRGVKFKLD